MQKMDSFFTFEEEGDLWDKECVNTFATETFLDAKHKRMDVNDDIQIQKHLDQNQKEGLHCVLAWHTKLFNWT